MNLLDQLKRDLDPKSGLDLIVKKDLSFEKKPLSTVAETYRSQLNIIAQSVVKTMTHMLDILTVTQLEELTTESEGKVFLHPQEDDVIDGVKLDGIYKEGNTWWFVLLFADDRSEVGSYRLQDMNVADVLWLMDRLETLIAKK